MDFARGEPELSYYGNGDHFNDLLALQETDYSSLALKIDSDIKFYWKSSLLKLLEFHKERADDYRQYFGVGDKNKHQPYLHGVIYSNHLNMVEKDILITCKKFPTYEFKNPEDVKYWELMVNRFAPVCSNAFNIHGEVFKLIKGIKTAKKIRAKNRANLLGNVVSKAIKLGASMGIPGVEELVNK